LGAKNDRQYDEINSSAQALLALYVSFPSEKIEIKIHAAERSRPALIVKEALVNNFGSIVVERRETSHSSIHISLGG
jgi:hypothetical protein